MFVDIPAWNVYVAYMPKQTAAVRLDHKALAALARIAHREDRTISAVLRRIIADWLRKSGAKS